MKKRNIVILIFLGFCLTSCITIDIGCGFHHRTERERKFIYFLPTNDSIPELLDTGKFYAITPQHLLDYIKKYDSCLIYFRSGCPAEPSLSACEAYCQKHNYRLILILKTYCYVPDVKSFYLPDRSMFCVNSYFYETDYSARCIEKFKKDLLGKQYKSPKEGVSMWWLYKDKQFHDMHDKLDINELTQ